MPAKPDYFSTDALRRDLKGRAVRGGLVTAGGQGLTVAVQLAAVPALARLLDPRDFGLVAMVTFFTGFAAMFVDAGMSMATVQREQINQHQVSNLFWLATSLGLLVAIVIDMLSPAIAWFYREPRLVAITIALSTSFVFSGLTIQHQALLRRGMQFVTLATIQVVTIGLSNALAIAVAWYYHSYWALVVLPVSMAATRMIGTWWASGWRPGLPRRGSGVREMVGFGANLTGFNLINYFARNADNMLIGWWWGANPLGFYDRGYRIMMAPLNQINAPLAGIMIPALSRLQDQPAKYRTAYFRAVSILQVVSCPLMAFVAITAPWVVNVVFGPGWEETGPILRWLAIAGFLQPMANSLGWLYISQGRGSDMMRWGMVGSSLIVVSFVLGLAWGPVGVARAYAVAFYTLIVPLSYWYVGCNGPVTTNDLWRLSLSAILLASPTIIVSMLVVRQFSDWTSAAGLLLSGILSAIATVVAAVSTHSGRELIVEFKALLQHAIGMPGKT
jgi:polysaccharide transporter, PST family